MPLSPWNRKKPRLEETTINAQFSLCCCTSKCRMAKSRPAFFVLDWGAQAASLFISAACRDAFSPKVAYATSVAGKLPATAGWQPALPSCIPHSAFYNPHSRPGA
jgi:hypothetical protein